MRINQSFQKICFTGPTQVSKAVKSGEYHSGGKIPLKSATCTNKSNRQIVAPLCAMGARDIYEPMYQVSDTYWLGKVSNWGD